ncbi:MAG TPA: sulfotransferase [Steroidobacteraceae bacterium]|nr:sulfotransferase [Steroidobacteraceae bacterium]
MTLTVDESAALLRAAYAALESGNVEMAEANCRDILRSEPREAQALALFGYLQLTQGRFGEALPTFEQLCQLEPQQASHWLNLGNALRGIGEPDKALQALARAAELGEQSVNFLFNLGLTHMARGDFEAARNVLGDALRLAPGDAEIRHRYIMSCYECMQFEPALAALQNWTPPAGAAPETVAGIAQVLLNMGEFAHAESILRTAVGSDAGVSALIILVQIYERTNRLAQAQALLDRLRTHPDARTLGSDLQRVGGKLAQRRGDHELAVELYRQALVEYAQPHDRHFIQFPLAESLHALGRHDETIKTLLEAHRSQAIYIKRSRPLTVVRGTPQMEVTEFPCDPADVATWDHSGAPPAEASPVFVVAFPRSGTTLLELTLDSHPLLRSMDEQPFVQNILEDILALGVKYPEQLGRLTAQQLEELRARYHGRVRRKVQLEPGQRLVDKNPLNILRLPVIRRVFPNAPILLAIRHPYDVLLSCYMQHFRAPDFALLCADMPSLTVGYRKTFDFWYEHVQMLAPRVLEVRYESFVSDLNAQVARIVEFLQLPWSDAMLAPAERARAKGYISTPSYSQVVQPVNRKAVGKWQAYRPYLEPARPVLEPYLKRWGYEG